MSIVRSNTRFVHKYPIRIVPIATCIESGDGYPLAQRGPDGWNMDVIMA